MFLQGLGAAAERQTRVQHRRKPSDESLEATAASAAPSVDDEAKSQTSAAAAAPDGGLQRSGPVGREVLRAFLDETAAKMLSADTRARVLREYESGVALHRSIIEFQRECVELYGLERDYGCKVLGLIPMNFKGDTDLFNRVKRFMFLAMKLLLSCIDELPERELQREGTLTRDQVLDFFEACDARMIMPDTKQALRAHFAETGEMPNALVIQMQKEMLEKLKIERDFGVAALNGLRKNFPNDAEVLSKMQGFAMCAHWATQEACMSEEQRKRFYEGIPPFMVHTPHIHVMQLQRRQAMSQQQQCGHHHHHGPNGHAHDCGHDHAHEGGAAAGDSHGHQHGPECRHGHAQRPPLNTADVAREVQAAMSNPEIRQNMDAVSRHISSRRADIQAEVAGMSHEQRQEFVQGFTARMQSLMSDIDGASFGDRVMRIARLSHEEQDDLIRLSILSQGGGAGAAGGGLGAGISRVASGIGSGIMSMFRGVTGDTIER